MNWAETPITFYCGHDQLVGVVTRPPASRPRSGLGVLVVVGGPQYRAGSHRQFVQLARRFAEEGHIVMRFDVRGMGDSTGNQRAFTDLDDDIDAAVSALSGFAGHLYGVVLWGLCDGASAALLYLSARADARVKGVCLLNPWVRSEQTLARVHVRHYYLRRFADPAFWRKLIRGGVGFQAISDLLLNLRAARARPAASANLPFQDRMADGLARFGGLALVLLSEDDHTAQEFRMLARSSATWRMACGNINFQQCDVAGADHTLSERQARRNAEQAMLDWLRGLAPVSNA